MKSTTLPIPQSAGADQPEIFKKSALYKEFLAEREEILCHKWLESEKAGYDIGFERALLDWIVRHRSAWREKRQTALQTARSRSEP